MLVYWKLVGPDRFKFRALAFFCGTFFYKAGNKSMQHRNLCVEHIEQFVKIVVLVMTLMILAYAIVFAVPMYDSHHQHNRMTPLATNLPFFEKDSLTEYYVNWTIQLIMATYSLGGTFVIEIAACAINHAILLVPDLMQFNLFEFQNEWNSNGVNTKSLTQLRNSFIQLQDYNRFDVHFFFQMNIFSISFNCNLVKMESFP